MNLRINAESSSMNQGNLEESLESGSDAREHNENHALTEVATLNGNDYLFTKQEQVFLVLLFILFTFLSITVWTCVQD